MKNETTIVLIDDRLSLSAARDAFSFGTLVAMIAVGWLLDSSAMQWVGAIVWFMWLIGRATSLAKVSRCTPEQARERIDAILARDQTST